MTTDPPTDHTAWSDDEDRYLLGLERVVELDGPGALDWAADLRSFSPDFERFVVETAYGNVWSRPGLSARDREIATIAALIAMGNARPELVSHMVMGRRIGITRDEVIEIIFQMAVYAGFPVAIEALAAAREAFDGPDAGPARDDGPTAPPTH